MAKSRPKIKKLINESSLVLRDLMEQHLREIGTEMVNQIVGKLSRLTPSQRLKAINDVKRPGTLAYKQAMQEAFAVIAYDALESARKDVPSMKHLKLSEDEESWKLGEWEKLPPSVQKKILKQQQLLVVAQLDDLDKQIKFQFNHSIDSTDSLDLIAADLEEALDDFVSGPRILAGSSSMAAQVINETRDSFFDLPEVQEQIDAFEFVNEDPVSVICQDLAGTIFAADDPDRFRYTPPLHFNCKSWIRPILSGNLGDREIEKLKPSTKRIEDTIQFSEHGCECCSLTLQEE